MIRLFLRWSLVVAVLLAGRPGGAEPAAPAKLAIDQIELKLFDQESGRIRSWNDKPNPYGMDMDLVVQVRVHGKLEPDKTPSGMVLSVSAPGWSDEATGSHSPWRLTQKAAFRHLPESGVRYFLFVLPYQDCYGKVTFTASLTGRGGGASKSLKTSLACAE